MLVLDDLYRGSQRMTPFTKSLLGKREGPRTLQRGPCYSRVPGRRSNWLPISNPIKLLHYGFVPTGGILNGVPVP